MATVRVLYCPVWNGYDERAASLAAEINRATPHAASTVPGEKSQFDVLVDDRLIFSKQQQGRFPDKEEILAALRDWVAVSRSGKRLYNAFPIRYFERGTRMVAHPNAGPRILLPRLLTPPVLPRREPAPQRKGRLRANPARARVR